MLKHSISLQITLEPLYQIPAERFKEIGDRIESETESANATTVVGLLDAPSIDAQLFGLWDEFADFLIVLSMELFVALFA